MRNQLACVALTLAAASCAAPEDSLGHEQAEVVVADGGIPRRSSWSYWDRGGDLGTAWRDPAYADASWARGAGPLGYGESYLGTTIGYGGDSAAKHITTYFRTQFTLGDPAPVRALAGSLMYDDGVVVYLNGQEIGRASMPSGTIGATTLAPGHETGNAYRTFDWTAHKSLLRAGTNTIAVEVHQVAASSSDLVFDLELTIDVAPPPSSGGIARGASWSYWDRGGDLGTAWRTGGSGWATGAGPLGYGEPYLRTVVGYGGDPDAKHVTTYFRTEFTVADPAAVRTMLGELMYDDGAVVYLNGQEVGRASMPSGAITASTFALGHEAGNSYQTYDWTAARGLLRAGTNTLAVEVHQASASSSDLVFDLALTLTTGPTTPPPTDDLPRGSTWAYWDRGGDLGTAWRSPSFDDSGWSRGPGPLGYGETYHATTVGYGGDPGDKHITTYFRASVFIEDPQAVDEILAEVWYDDGFVVYINGHELTRMSMPAGTITASTLATGHEPGGDYEAYYWTTATQWMVPGENVIAVEVHQASPSSSDLTFDLALTIETAARDETRYGIPSGSTWGYWDRGDDLGTAWRAPGYEEVGWRAGAAPLGFGESYVATRTASGPITTYFRHDFTPFGSPTEWALEAMYDDGFIAYLNGTEVLRVGLPAGPITARTLAAGHEAAGYQRFALPGAAALIVPGTNTLAIEVHQASATSSDLVWDARLVKDVRWPRAWQAQTSGTPQSLHDVWFTDLQRGWAVGDAGTVLRTVDGGATWAPQPVPVTGGMFDIEFADAQHGWIMAYPDQLLATVDGGETWFVRATVPALKLSFIDATTGWTSGPGIHRTDDGGATWQLQLFDPNIGYHTIHFADALHGWALGRVEEGGGGDVNGANVVIHTSDGGVTWQRQLTRGEWNESFGAIDAADATRACVVGTGNHWDALDEYKHLTTDGGATWQFVPDTSNGTALHDVDLLDADLGWAVGYGGSIIHTADGGATWAVQEAAAWEYLGGDHTRPLAPSLHGVHFVDAQHGWAVGAGGTIVATSTGGD